MEQAALATRLPPHVAAGMVVIASPADSCVSTSLWRWMITSPGFALLCATYETQLMSPQRIRLPVNSFRPPVLAASAGILQFGGDQLSSTLPLHQLPEL